MPVAARPTFIRMKHPLSSRLLGAALMLGLAASALAVPAPPKPPKPPKPPRPPSHAANSAQLLRAHTATSQQQLLLKARENFFKQHLLEQAHRPERLAGIGGGKRADARRRPVTEITPDSGTAD